MRVVETFNATEEMLIAHDLERELRLGMRNTFYFAEKYNDISRIFLTPEKQGTGLMIKHTRDPVFARGESPTTGCKLERNFDDKLIDGLSLSRESEDGKASQHQEQTQV